MFCVVAVEYDSQKATGSHMDSPGDASQAWADLAPDYERARSREDSLDRLVEWPAQRDLLGDVTGRSVLDLGCGDGGKLAELVREGATAAVGVDVSGNFLGAPPPGLELIQGDLNELDSVAGLAGARLTASCSCSLSATRNIRSEPCKRRGRCWPTMGSSC